MEPDKEHIRYCLLS